MSIARAALLRASRSPWLADQFRRRRFARRAVRRFMPGEDVESALDACADFSRSGIGTVLTNLGERIQRWDEAAAVRDHYLAVDAAIAQQTLPTELSVKLTHLGMTLDQRGCIDSVVALARRAEARGALLWLDIEESYYVDQTLEIFRAARQETKAVGLCLQSYLRRTPADLESLLPLEPAIRLVKGAYREPPDVAFPKKQDTDRAYRELACRMLDQAAAGRGKVILGTHDLRLVDDIRRHADAVAAPPDRWEVHMLYGIKSREQRELAAAGVPLRVLISYGANWFPWYMRRLAERPANVWFVIRNIF